MKSVEWKTYRTRFLVQAKQLNSALSFVDPLGRTHCGRKGDYLVESSDGVISIAPRQIFEDIYVQISQSHDVQPEQTDEKFGGKKPGESGLNESNRESGISERKLALVPVEKKRVTSSKLQRGMREEKLCACPTLNIAPLNIEEVELRPIAKRPATSSRGLRRDEAARVRRKLPQHAGEHALATHLGLM
jgi:hypothetical protein